MSKKILIAGANGFLGRYTALKFKQEGYSVYGVGIGKWAINEKEQYGIDFWIEAFIDKDSLKSFNVEFDGIINCSGGSSVAYSVTNPAEDFKLTVESSISILEYIRLNNPAAKLVYPSSAAVYGAREDCPLKETDKPNPISPYGYHKKIVEELMECYSKNYALKAAIIRFFSIYGNGIRKQLLWDACNKIKAANNEAVFFGTGEETRDWINVQDAASLLYAAYINNSDFEIFNGATGKRVTVRETLNLIVSGLDKTKQVAFNGQCKEGDPKYYHADMTKVASLDWAPSISLENGIESYVKWVNTIQ